MVAARMRRELDTELAHQRTQPFAHAAFVVPGTGGRF
jgi:hypothetical protein